MSTRLFLHGNTYHTIVLIHQTVAIVCILLLSHLLLLEKDRSIARSGGGSREGFPYHSQWSSNFTAIFDGNYKLLPSIDLEKFYGQVMRWRGRNPSKAAPVGCTIPYKQKI